MCPIAAATMPDATMPVKAPTYRQVANTFTLPVSYTAFTASYTLCHHSPFLILGMSAKRLNLDMTVEKTVQQLTTPQQHRQDIRGSKVRTDVTNTQDIRTHDSMLPAWQETDEVKEGLIICGSKQRNEPMQPRGIAFPQTTMVRAFIKICSQIVGRGFTLLVRVPVCICVCVHICSVSTSVSAFAL